MLNIKVITLHDSKPLVLLFNSETTLPMLYPTLYVMSSLKLKSESTQKTYLTGIKQFYEFWQKKHKETFCKYFIENKSDPYLMIQEFDSFVLYLENNQEIDDKIIKLGSDYSLSYETLAMRLRSLISFFGFLLDNYSHIHGTPLKSEIAQYRTVLAQKSKIVTSLSATNYKNKSFKAVTNFKSLTQEMRDALYKIISPTNVESPIFLSNFAKFRNYLILHLLLNYGLRSGELLLLSLKSIKTDLRTNNTYMVVTDTNDSSDTRKVKPHIKNRQSVRMLLLEKKDAMAIKVYIEKIRAKDVDTDLLFLSNTKPYAPLSSSSLKKIFKIVNDEMMKNYPHFFDKKYVDSIDRISPHTFRHTWAYITLKSNYENYLNSNSRDDAMSLAVSNLRKLAGWSLESQMPYLYANRFVSEHANDINIQRINKGK